MKFFVLGKTRLEPGLRPAFGERLFKNVCRSIRYAWLAVAAAGFSVGVMGQAPAVAGAPVVVIEFSNPALIPAHWVLALHPDGSGQFHSERGTAAGGGGWRIEAPDMDRAIHLSAAFAGSVFDAARRRKLFNLECESKLKVAFEGWKTLSYKGPEGTGSCRFNYSRDKEIQALGDELVGVAATLVEGARLATLEQHDRLGLDREIEGLVEGYGDGRFEQVCVIRGILSQLAQDPAVLERVHKRARELLAKADQEEAGK